VLLLLLFRRGGLLLLLLLDGRPHLCTKFGKIEFHSTGRRRIDIGGVMWMCISNGRLHGTIQIPHRRVNNPFMLRPSRTVTVTVTVTVTITAMIAIVIVIVIRRVRILGQKV